MFIEDEELRTLYRDTSKEHLDDLEAGVLHLEQQPNDFEKIKQLLRHTHSLKGDSRMLGVDEAETISHQIEELLSRVDKQELSFTSTLCDRLCQGIDALRHITREAVTGEPSKISTLHVLDQLRGVETTGIDDTPVNPSPVADIVTLPSAPTDFAKASFASLAESMMAQEQDVSEHSAEIGNPNDALDFDALEALDIAALETELQADQPLAPLTLPEAQPAPQMDNAGAIDTVRVATSKLDTLATQAGELVIAKGRISQRLNDINAVLSLWETWSKQTVGTSLSSAYSAGTDASGTKRLQQVTKDRLGQLGELLKQLYASTYDDYSQLEAITNTLESDILQLRRLPLSNVFSLFPRMVRDLAKQQNKAINLVIEGGDIQADKRILEEMKDPLIHLVRNAIDHGIETPSERAGLGKPPTATIMLKASQTGNQIRLDVIDDGRGLNSNNIKQTALSRGLYTAAELSLMDDEQIQNLIFAPGFSTRTVVTELSGRGVGLDVVHVGVERLKGTIQVQSTLGEGCTFRFLLNTSLATTPALVMMTATQIYALPLADIDRIVQVQPSDIFNHEGAPSITYQAAPMAIAWLHELLNLTERQVMDATVQQSSYCIVLKTSAQRFGILVDDLIDQQDIIVKPHSKLIKRIPNIAGSTILNNGTVAMVLEAKDLATSLQKNANNVLPINQIEQIARFRVLLVEDSVPIRTQIRRILEKVGYHVTTAVDGLEGLKQLQKGAAFDAVVSDVEMPNLDGLSLTRHIRQELKNVTLPIILITTLAGDDDRIRGAEAGANAYLTKGNFEQRLLIDTLRNLIE